MHLRRYNNRNQEQEQTQAPPLQQVQKEPEFNWDKLTLPKEVRELAASRKILHKKIEEIEQRLRFGYSKPLFDYKMQLVKEDIDLSCKMTEYLIALPTDKK